MDLTPIFSTVSSECISVVDLFSIWPKRDSFKLPYASKKKIWIIGEKKMRPWDQKGPNERESAQTLTSNSTFFTYNLRGINKLKNGTLWNKNVDCAVCRKRYSPNHKTIGDDLLPYHYNICAFQWMKSSSQRIPLQANSLS